MFYNISYTYNYSFFYYICIECFPAMNTSDTTVYNSVLSNYDTN